MGNKIGVLVFPAGEINSVELHDALATCVNIELYGASSVDRHGEYVFRNYIADVPKINDNRFLDALNEIIVKNSIDVIIPTHDDVALFLAEHKEKIKAKTLTPDYYTALICRDKKQTYELFREEEFCPKVWAEPIQYPVFIKPRRGQGGVGAKVIKRQADVPLEMEWSEYVVCEYLPGEELTVDCLTDKNGKLQAIMPRSHQRVFGGVSVHAKCEVLTEEIRNIAESINQKLNFLGLWYFQIKQDENGCYKLLEIATRCAGTMCVSRAKGVNLPLLSVYAAMGRDIAVYANDYALEADRMLITRYKTDLEYDTVYIDLDDTILINGKVHLPMIRFIYQCVNEGKRIVLLTRHACDHADSVQEVLRKHRISSLLFDEIVELSFDVPKYTVIKDKNAIFIDNAYAERKQVYENCGIAVFDVDGIEVLLDWRT